MGSRTKVLIVADVHYSLKQYDWLTRVAGEYDLLIIAGDLLDLAGHADMDTQIVVVRRYLKKLSERTTVIASSGNHDGDVCNEAKEYVATWLRGCEHPNLHVDFHSLRIGDTRFSICPWWDGPDSREEMRVFLESEATHSQRRWVWVHHAPPDGSPVSWTGKKDAGDEYLRELLGQHTPDLVISGHIHNSPFRKGGSWIDRVGKTWCVNPGRQIGPAPSYISLDLDRMVARWISDYDSDQRQMA